MYILIAIVIIICVFIIALFGAAAASIIGKNRNEKGLKEQNELFKEIEDLRREVYEDNRKLNERITTLSINQQILENNFENFLNK